MRAIAAAVGIVCAALRVASGAPEVAAIYWQPPGQPPPGESARAAFAHAVQPLGIQVSEVATPAPAPAALAPGLAAAQAEYAKFSFPAAIALLDALAREADAHGGGELDARQLSEIFLYRGLSRLETGPPDAAWDDLVRAARLDPTRIMDPAAFPPRAVTAYNRAVAEAAKLPRVELEVAAPADALVRVDGTAVAGVSSVMLGQHYIAVTAEGYEPWAGVVSVSGVKQRFAPPLRRYRAPDADKLLAIATAAGAHRLLVGALERMPEGWRFVARDFTLPDGRFSSDSVALGDGPVQPAIARLIERLKPSRAAPRTAAPLGGSSSGGRRWWVWAVAGGVVAAAAITVVLVSGGSTDSVGGSLSSLTK